MNNSLGALIAGVERCVNDVSFRAAQAEAAGHMLQNCLCNKSLSIDFNENISYQLYWANPFAWSQLSMISKLMRNYMWKL